MIIDTVNGKAMIVTLKKQNGTYTRTWTTKIIQRNLTLKMRRMERKTFISKVLGERLQKRQNGCTIILLYECNNVYSNGYFIINVYTCVHKHLQKCIWTLRGGLCFVFVVFFYYHKIKMYTINYSIFCDIISITNLP